MSSSKREDRTATARPARDSDLLQAVERRLEQEARGLLDRGALDRARRRAQALTTAGAKLVYREIEDLSHTYPRDENPKILDWLLRPLLA